LINYVKIILTSITLATIITNAADINPYGFIRFNGVWNDFEKADRFDFSASQSTFGISARDSAPESWLILTGKLEGDFVDDYHPVLNHGFINFSFPNAGLNILVGKTWSLFVPYDPPTVNYNNLVGAGNLAKERPQIRITQKFGSIEIAAAARKDSDYPAVEGRISTATQIKIGTSAFYASEKTEPASWGIAADMFAPIGIVNISGEFFMGENLSNYGGISEPYYRNVKFGVKSIGGWGALGFRASDNLSFNAGAGAEKIAEKAYWPLIVPWFNAAIFANINYKLTKAATLALEYYRQDTEYMDNTKDGYNRIETAITYEF